MPVLIAVDGLLKNYVATVAHSPDSSSHLMGAVMS
jgi:hypothetical protein